MTPRLKSFDSKGSIKFFYDIIAELKQDGLISHRHEALLRRTPFHYILQLPYLELNISLLQELLVNFDNFDNSLTIAEHHLPFKSEDVALIFGLPNHGKPVKLNSIKNKDFYHRVFEKGAVSRFEIVYHLRRHAMDQSDLSNEAFVVLLLGLFISTVLIPSSNAGISSSLWSYLDELDHICDYDWAHLVYRELIDEINRAKREAGDEGGGDESSGNTYGGCFLALQLWICHIAGLGKAERQDCSPRILNWGRNSMDGILEQFRSLGPSDIRSSLSPMDSERHLLDSTILPCDAQTSDLSNALIARKDEHKKVLRFNEELQRAKGKGLANLLSESFVGDSVRNNTELQTTDMEENGAPSVASDSSGSTEKTVKKIVEWQLSNTPSIRRTNKELSKSKSGPLAGGKLVASKSMKNPGVNTPYTSKQHSEGEHNSVEREVKKRVDRLTSQSTSSSRAKQKEAAKTLSGNGAGTKLSPIWNKSFKKFP